MEPTDHDMLSDLVLAAQRGDVEAYGRIVELTQQIIAATVRRIIDDPHESDDVMQETYLRAFHTLGQLRDRQALLAWLQQVARRMALNHMRQRRWAFIDGSDPPDRIARDTDEDARQRDLTRAMANLSPDDRRLCERYYHGGWTTARLAADLSITELAVRKRLERIRNRLRKDITMPSEDLPERIVELLGKPDLTALPENPVGAIWQLFREGHADCEQIELPERVERSEAAEFFGEEAINNLPSYLADMNEQGWLRADLTVPMLLAARSMPGKRQLIATGKTYRVGAEPSETRLQAFHQAEVLLILEELDEWVMMGRIASFIDRITGGARLQIRQVDLPLYCSRGWVVDVQWPGEQWNSICGWGRVKDELIAKLGYDPEENTGVGVGMGLERLACLKYGIDDIRKVEAMRV